MPRKLSPRGRSMGWSVVALALLGYVIFGRQAYWHYVLPVGIVLVLIIYMTDGQRQ